MKARNFSSVEEKLINYLNLRGNNYQKEKFGVSWYSLRVILLKWHKLDTDLSDETLECSYG